MLNSLRLLELAAEGGNNRVTIFGDVQMEVKPLQSLRLRPVYRSRHAYALPSAEKNCICMSNNITNVYHANHGLIML